ncbi:hypothetical protein BDV96DRAFT_46671 [Lophiotrema nucula]|uniref:Secreted protein n=1 Tax=Lophiotrema nucula TaxID=690887 RepID=A0A6A5ZAH6_9PLEO|nr:hypothetical protein BDV96DRAFT_46671 [Lophiotrema nucula]
MRIFLLLLGLALFVLCCKAFVPSATGCAAQFQLFEKRSLIVLHFLFLRRLSGQLSVLMEVFVESTGFSGTRHRTRWTMAPF